MLVALSVFFRYACGSQLPIMYPATPCGTQRWQYHHPSRTLTLSPSSAWHKEDDTTSLWCYAA